MDVRLDPEQERLLVELVRTHRQVPRAKRADFAVIYLNQGDFLRHSGLPHWFPSVLPSDLRILARYGLIDAEYSHEGVSTFALTPEGVAYADALDQGSADSEGGV